MELTVEQFVAACERAAGLVAEDLAGSFPDVETIVRMGIEDNFDNERSAADFWGGGGQWPERKVKGDGHPLLNESGALRAAATQKGAVGSVSRIEGDTLEVGVEASGPGGLPGARRHQYGDSPPGIRQREFVGISDDTLEFVAERVAEELVRKLF